MLRVLTLFHCIFLPLVAFSQTIQSQNGVLTDSTYEFLLDGLDNAPSNKAALLLSTALIQKAKKNNDAFYLAEGYKSRIYLEDSYTQRLKYNDSMIAASVTLDASQQASAYLTRGAVHYSANKFIPALNCYLKAETLLGNHTNDPLYFKTLFCIGQMKYFLGYYKEVISLLYPCLKEFKKADPRGYLNALHLLGLCYNRTGSYALSSKINKEGLTEAAKIQESVMLAYFLHSEGVNQYYLKNYAEALKHLEGTMTFLESREDKANIAVAFYYIGLTREALGEKPKALDAFKKVYNISTEIAYVRPDIVPAFKKLIAHSESIGDIKGQLRFTNALLKADSILNADFRYLSDKLSREYDTRMLRNEKKALQAALLEKNHRTTYAFIGITVAVSVLLALRYNRNRKRVLSKDEGIETVKESGKTTAALKEEIALPLLDGLQKFEKDKRYLEKGMTLARMAKILDTNPKYVMMLVHQYRENKKTLEYINELKITYLVQLLAENTRARNYTHKALAAEIGYNTTNSLHKAFLKYRRISFSEYLAALQLAGHDVSYPETYTSPDDARSGTHG
ncbi:MAG: hypothetical protein ACLGH8_14995 [Bacteroidia bacterium]